MGNFNRGGDRGGDRGGFRGGNGGGGFGRPSFDKRGGGSMHQTTCADCGKTCEVPFVPKEGRPVYCTECFGKKGGRDGGEKRDFNRGGDRPSFQKPTFEAPKFDMDTKRRLESIEYKVDKLIHAMDLLLGSKIPKSPETKAVKKDANEIKQELTDVVKKVSKEIEKDAKVAVKEVKKAVKEVKAKVKGKGKK